MRIEPASHLQPAGTVLPPNETCEALGRRLAAKDISVIGRNTQGVKIMTVDDDDSLAAVVRVPREEGDGDVEEATGPATE